MPSSREAILERIRVSTGSGLGTDSAGEWGSLPRSYRRSGGLDLEGRLHLLMDRLRDYDAKVVETSAASVAQAVLRILTEHGQKRVIVADGFPAALLPVDGGFLSEREAGLQDLNDCDGIVTLCTVAIATTGTVVLTHGRGEGARRLTLVPDRHLCILRADQVVETVPEAFDRLAVFATHPLTFISGPSATADIEMTRIRGVHGPRFLDVVLAR